MSIRNKLKNCRKQSGYTQEEIAEKINVSRQTISNWETGKTLPDIYNLISLSDLYNISLDKLIKGDATMIKNLKLEQSLKERNKNSLIFGVIGIISLLISTLINNSNISSFISGLGVGLMGTSIIIAIVINITYYLKNKKNINENTDN